MTDSRGQEMGYRPLEIDDVELEQICTDIDTAETDRERLKHFKPLQDIARRVQATRIYVFLKFFPLKVP